MTARDELPRPARTVEIDLRARRAYPWMAGIVLSLPGLILEDEGSGIRVRVLADGSLEELVPGGMPRPSIASDPCATRRP